MRTPQRRIDPGVIRRLLQMIPVFIGSTFLIFFMVYALVDPVAALFGDLAPDPATAAQIRHDLYLDHSLGAQYVHYMKNIFIGDFGTAFTGEPVTELIGQAFPVTIRLTIVAILFEIIIGIALGVVTGMKIVPLAPKCRQAKATPWAWLPALAQTKWALPAAPGVTRLRMALNAPRSL